VCDPTEPETEEERFLEEEDPEEPGYGEPTPAECPQSCFPADVPPGLPADSAGVPAKLRAFSCEPFSSGLPPVFLPE